MREIIAIKHITYEGLGHFENYFLHKGWRVNYVDINIDPHLQFDPLAPDLLISLGGPISVYHHQDFPGLDKEVDIIQARLQKQRPTLGICLGSQLIAKAAGANVYPGTVREIGWSGITLSPDGKKSPLIHLDSDKTCVLHWHGDTFDLPISATHLASTDLYPNQAFSIGNYCLALQFHLEVTAKELEAWYVSNYAELRQRPGGLKQLREAALQHALKLQLQAQLLMDDWFLNW